MDALWRRAFIALVLLCLIAGQARAQDNDTDSGGDDSGAVTAVKPDNGTDAAEASADNSADNSADAADDNASDRSAPAVAAAGPAVNDSSPDSARSGDLDQITMNFQNVDIPILVKFISEITGKNFVLDESVRGKVSVISPTKVTPQQAYSIFQSVLQVKGFTTIQAGPVIKIVPARDVRNSAKLTQSQMPGLTHGDEYVTRMVKLRNTDATSVMSIVQPMVSHDGLVAAFPQDNTLIITDDAFNVERLLKIIGSLDVQGVQQNVAVVPLKLAFADDVAQQIEKIMSARETAVHGGQIVRPGMGVVAPSAQGAATNFSIVPDERTNSIIVLASPLEMRQIKELVRRLDVPSPNGTFRIHVYHLKYAPASEMVDVLNGLLSGGGGPSTLSPTTGRNSLGRGSSLGLMSGSSFGSGFGGGAYGASYGGLGGGYGGSSSMFGGGSYGGGAMSGLGGGGAGMGRGSRNTSNNGPETASGGGGGARNSVFENPVSVTADPSTNSLVVSAAPQDYQTLRHVIAELDVPRVQVFVQAIIVEVSVNRARDIGVNFLTSTGIGNTLGVGELNFGQLQNALGNPLGLTGLGVGLASGSKCSIPIATSLTASGTSSGSTITAPCDIALMTALQSDVHSNVLSAPTLLTADNEEAMIVVGQNVPFVGSAAANAGLPGQIFNSVDRQNVGITLDIVPQVSAGDSIKLDVYEEVSNVVPGTNNQATNPLGPTTTIRSASTSVLVLNHRTAVIGGLISTDAESQRQGVPFLSDIPVLGNLFSDNSRNLTKQNLLVFLTPHIVRSRNDLQSLALDERQKFVRSLGRAEVNTMPPSQFQQLYQPTFNGPISPTQDMMQRQQLLPENNFAPMPGTAAPLPPAAGSSSSALPPVGSGSSSAAPFLGGSSATASASSTANASVTSSSGAGTSSNSTTAPAEPASDPKSSGAGTGANSSSEEPR